METLAWLVLFFVSVFVFACLFIFWLMRMDKDFWKKLFTQPIKYVIPTNDIKKITSVLTNLRELNILERMSVIQQTFGRPIRFVFVMDKSGECFVEGVTYYYPETEADSNYHLNELLFGEGRKKKPDCIG